MAATSITTEHGTIIELFETKQDTLVLLSNPSKYPDKARDLAGRLALDGAGFQPAPSADFAMRPSVLRAIADLIEKNLTKGA